MCYGHVFPFVDYLADSTYWQCYINSCARFNEFQPYRSYSKYSNKEL